MKFLHENKYQRQTISLLQKTIIVHMECIEGYSEFRVQKHKMASKIDVKLSRQQWPHLLDLGGGSGIMNHESYLQNM